MHIKKGIYCASHKVHDMINVLINKCQKENCITTANYNNIGNKRGIFCATHKLDGMICVTKKLCAHEGCIISPSFNIQGTTKGKYCIEHKLEGMINVVIKQCIHPNCTVYPSYNSINKHGGLYCVTHKLEGMVDVTSNTCEYTGCMTRATYNISTEKKAQYCAKHKTEEMISINGAFCNIDGCNIRSIYNFMGEARGIYCNKHKLAGMVNVKDKKCMENDCYLIPSFNLLGETKGLFCAKHKTSNMVNVIEKTCKTPFCGIQIKDKYEGYCLRCFTHQYPDKPVSRNYKTKERSVMEFLQKEFSSYPLVYDKRIGDSLKRPDVFLDLASHSIIIEVDENQHIAYDCTCENKRMMQISSDLHHKSAVFIRFNPDRYYDAHGALHESCWKTDTNSINCIVRSEEWHQRLISLRDQVRYWIDNPPDKMIEIIQLYYDQQ